MAQKQRPFTRKQRSKLLKKRRLAERAEAKAQARIEKAQERRLRRLAGPFEGTDGRWFDA